MRQQNISKNWLLVCFAVLVGLKGSLFANEIDYSLNVKNGDSSVFRMPFEGNHTNILATNLSYGGAVAS